MNASEFARLWRKEKDAMVESFLGGETLIGQKIAELELDDRQKALMSEIVDGIVSDTIYTSLLVLDGASSIGGFQQMYKVYDEDENLISDCGDLESAAWEAFYADGG